MSKIFRYAGFAQEADFAEDPAPAAVFHVDIGSSSLDSPSDTQMVYEGGLGRGARTHRPGFYAPAGNVMYAFDIATIGWLLKWTLGGYAFTGGTGQSLHEMFGVDDRILDSFCTRVGKDVFEQVFSGCVINQLQVQIEDSFCQATADIVASKDAKAALAAAADLILPAQYPLAFHEVTAKLGGVDESAKIKSLSLTIANGAQADAGRGIGSRHPYRIPVAEREVTADLSMWYGDTAELERYWGGAGGPAAGGTTEVALEVTADAGADGQLVLSLPRTIYTQVQQQPSGRGEIVQSGAVKALVDTIALDDASTVESELLASLTNDEADMT